MPKRDRALSPWSKELDELVAGAAGGFLFGTPLVYTLEVWHIGSYTQPAVLLALLALTYVIVFLLNRVEGFRKNKFCHPELNAALESVEALAIGIVCATFMLALLQRITLETPLIEGLGKIIFEAVPFSLGVTLSRLILEGGSKVKTSSNKSKRRKPKTPYWAVLQSTSADLGATLIGANMIAFSIAPTDEIPALAIAASPPWLLAIIAASMLISYGIVFAAGFTNQSKRRQQEGLFQRPLSETVFSYLVSLLASALMLWFFQRLSLEDPGFLWLSYSVLLGLPATIGGAAGRLAI